MEERMQSRPLPEQGPTEKGASSGWAEATPYRPLDWPARVVEVLLAVYLMVTLVAMAFDCSSSTCGPGCSTTLPACSRRTRPRLAPRLAARCRRRSRRRTCSHEAEVPGRSGIYPAYTPSV
jgi:hypothetical protein